MITLNAEQIIRLDKELLDATGGLDGLRDVTMLEHSK